MESVRTHTREEGRGTAPLPTAVGYCADCGEPLYRRCDLCGESEVDHPAYCDPEWGKRTPDLCARCEEIAEREYDDEDDPWDTGGDRLDD